GSSQSAAPGNARFAHQCSSAGRPPEGEAGAVASLVIELQRDALNPRVPVSSLLRKVVVVARKLGLRDLEKWTQLELRGYGRRGAPELCLLLRGCCPRLEWR